MHVALRSRLKRLLLLVSLALALGFTCLSVEDYSVSVPQTLADNGEMLATETGAFTFQTSSKAL